jgi:hypothetical protein
MSDLSNPTFSNRKISKAVGIVGVRWAAAGAVHSGPDINAATGMSKRLRKRLFG